MLLVVTCATPYPKFELFFFVLFVLLVFEQKIYQYGPIKQYLMQDDWLSFQKIIGKALSVWFEQMLRLAIGGEPQRQRRNKEELF